MCHVCLISFVNPNSPILSQMTNNVLDTTYNGWANYETWNVALCINNHEGLYNIAREAGDYQSFVESVSEFMTQTPDGVRFDDPAVNVTEINSEVFDF